MTDGGSVTEPSETAQGEGGDEAARELTPRAQPPRLWLWLTIAAIGYTIGNVIPLPGIDHEALFERTGGASGGLWAGVPVVAVFGVSIGAMVTIQLALVVFGAQDKPFARRVGLRDCPEITSAAAAAASPLAAFLRPQILAYSRLSRLASAAPRRPR